MNKKLNLAVSLLLLSGSSWALPIEGDRVYTGDQITNTVSVINPVTNTLLGQIKLGNVRPDVLSPIYKGEINVHGLGFSPDHKTLLAVSTGSNAVSFIDTETNLVKGTVYVGRSPHEGFFTPDGKEAWVVVRGENYISVINPKTFKEIRQIKTSTGPGMIIFNPNGKEAYVCNSFTPVFEIIDMKKNKVVKKIDVVSPFSPFLQITPDHKEIWLTHKDIGKVTRIDLKTKKVASVIDTGFITNHLGFAKTSKGVLAYVTVGGENAVKVYTTEAVAKLVTTIAVGALPHGIWPSDDGSHIYVGLENGDAVDVIDTESNSVVKRISIGGAPQALVYVSQARTNGINEEKNLVALADKPENLEIRLKPQTGEGKGFIAVRNLGLIDSMDVSLFKLKPNSLYKVFFVNSSDNTKEKNRLLAVLKTNEKGAAATTAISPVREFEKNSNSKSQNSKVYIFLDNDTKNDSLDLSKAVLVGEVSN